MGLKTFTRCNRHFGGKLFNVEASVSTKREAVNLAKQYRDRGYPARVVSRGKRKGFKVFLKETNR